jgi:diphthine-ammonia ligase
MRLGILFSGGKDSAMALWWAQQKHEASCLITMDSKNKESYMFHTDKVKEIPKLAKKLKIPLIFNKTLGVKEEELKDLKAAIQEAKDRYKITGIVSGALASNYQKTRVDNICKELGLKSFAPFWHKDEKEYLQQILDLGFEIQIVHVAAEGLSEQWVGKIIDQKFFDKIVALNKKYGVHIAGEGGEYETFVLDGPICNFSGKTK